MARKKKPEKEPNHERWLVSYGDLLTLLLAVFVVLYAMSQADKKKVEDVAASMRASFGMEDGGKGGMSRKPSVIDTGKSSVLPEINFQSLPQVQQTDQGGNKRLQATETDFRNIKASIDAYLIKAAAQSKVHVEINRRGLVVSLKEAGFFDSGSATVKQQSKSIIAVIAESLSDYANQLRVEGHTDNMPISTAQFRSNWELSSARANNIMHLLTESYGLEPERISTVGNSEYRPVDTNDTPEGRAKNRRVDIVILNSEGDKSEAKPSAQ